MERLAKDAMKQRMKVVAHEVVGGLPEADDDVERVEEQRYAVCSKRCVEFAWFVWHVPQGNV